MLLLARWYLNADPQMLIVDCCLWSADSQLLTWVLQDPRCLLRNVKIRKYAPFASWHRSQCRAANGQLTRLLMNRLELFTGSRHMQYLVPHAGWDKRWCKRCWRTVRSTAQTYPLNCTRMCSTPCSIVEHGISKLVYYCRLGQMLMQDCWRTACRIVGQTWATWRSWRDPVEQLWSW